MAFQSESRVEYARKIYQIINEVRRVTLSQGSMPISTVAKLAQDKGIEPADVLHVFESDQNCKVDWATDRIVCR